MELLDENYYTIKGFMLNRLHLKGIALVAQSITAVENTCVILQAHQSLLLIERLKNLQIADI